MWVVCSCGKGHLGPHDDLGQYSVYLSYPSQGDPCQPWKALCCCGNGGGLGGQPCARLATPAPPPLSGGSWSWQSPDLSGQIRKTQLGQDPAQSPAEGTVRWRTAIMGSIFRSCLKTLPIPRALPALTTAPLLYLIHPL